MVDMRKKNCFLYFVKEHHCKTIVNTVAFYSPTMGVFWPSCGIIAFSTSFRVASFFQAVSTSRTNVCKDYTSHSSYQH